MTNSERLLSITPSPFDNRDWIADSIYSKSTVVPKKLDLRNNLQKVRDQGSQGTCAAQSAACMKEWQEKKDVNFDSYFSPQFIYNLRINSESEGMYGRDVMRILYQIGCCPEESYEYGKVESKDKLLENTELIQSSSNYKIKHYAKLYTIENTKKALFQNGPCLICFPVYNHSEQMWIPEQGQNMMGGHAMTVVGYTEDSFIIRNSWGENWGNNGYCYYPFSQWGSHWELWTTIDDESYNPKIDPDADDDIEINDEENNEENNEEEENKEEENNEDVKKKERLCPFWFWF